MAGASPNTYFKAKIATIISVALSLFIGGATAVSTLYRVRDDTLKTVAQKQQSALKHYTTHEELLQALQSMNQQQNDRYSDLKDRINIVGNKVDGVVIYLRHKL